MDHHHQHHPTPPINDQEEEEEEDGTTTAGLLRAAIRSSINVYRMTVFGSYPRRVGRVPIKAVSRLSDQLGTAYDAYSVVTSTHKDIKEQQQQQKPGSSTTTSSFSSPSSSNGATAAAFARKAQLFQQTLKSATPQLVKSGFLGTLVFEVYAEAKERLDDAFLNNDQDDEKKEEVEGAPTSTSTSPWRGALVLPLTSVAGGAVAGACHGALYTGWEHGRRLVASSFKTASYPYVVKNVVGGTMAAHALAHSSLFGSFEIFKEGFMHLTGARHEEPLGVAVVGLAGGLAGLCEEAVSHLTPHWEIEGVSSLKESIKRHGLPQVRVISSAALPTAVGFLAYEYGKSAVLGKAAGEGEDED